MAWHKKLLKSSGFNLCATWLVASYIRFVYLTARKQFYYHDEAKKYMQGEANAIFAFWHGRMMLMPCLRPKTRPMHVLISLHRDGKFISDVMARFALKTIGGSSSKGGRAALVEMLALLQQGDNVSITPDGPRGPFQIAASGVAAAARLSGKPIIPVTFASSAHKRFSSWDKYMLAYPFARITFAVGAPIFIADDCAVEAARLQIEQAMNQLGEENDARLL